MIAQGLERAFSYPRALALALGLVLACGFEPLHLWPLAFLSLAGLIELIGRAPSWREAALRGWLFGLGSFMLGLNWIAHAFVYQTEMPAWLGWLAVMLLSAFLALWPALACLGAWKVGRTNYASLVLAMTGCWTAVEWLRGWAFTGFPWNPLAAIALGPFSRPGLALLARVMGTYALSGLVVMLAGAWLIALKRRRIDWRGALMVLGPVALMQIPDPGPLAGGRGTAFTLVQPDSRQEQLHDPANYESLFRRAMVLSQARQPGQVRLVLWPESGLPDFLHEGYPAEWYAATTYRADPRAARERIGALIGPGSMLLTGNDTLELKQGEVVGARAGIAAIDPSGTVRATYAKAHLVPFGEYVPLRSVLEPLGLARLVPGAFDFWPGPGPRTLNLGPWGKVGMQLCYEIIFSGQVIDPANRPDFIFNPSNDGWYGAWGPPQFMAQARLRAIEEGLPVLRSTTTGISGVIDAHGVVRQWVPWRQAGRVDGVLPAPDAPPLFARLGNMLAIAFSLLMIMLSRVASRRARD